MKSLKNLCAVIVILAMVFSLAACGGSNDVDDVLAGTYHSEADPGFVLNFSGDTFTMAMPFYQMGIPELDGDFVTTGTFTVDQSARTISFVVDEAAFENDIRQAIDELLLQDPDVQELLNDPETADFAEIMIAGMVDGMIGAMMDEILDEVQDGVMTFENDFSRLYDDDTVWVRQ